MHTLTTQAKAVEARLRSKKVWLGDKQMDQIADTIAALCTALEAAQKDAERLSIKLNKAEIQSGVSRVRWAEGLIRQLPEDHDGRNSWLLNYSDAVIKAQGDAEEFVSVGKHLHKIKAQGDAK